MKMKYDTLVIDTVNLAYKTFNLKSEEPLQLSKKYVYKTSICNFIRTIESLEEKYLHFDGRVYFLIDNYYSRADLESTFMFVDRKQLDAAYKATRKKENREFFNSINFLKYYYLINGPKYYTIRIDNLEADDLVKPLVKDILKDKSCLLVTSDLDWCRYLSDKVDWLPRLGEEPESAKVLQEKLGFPITETSLICYKALFGDKADNIPSLVTENEKNKAVFIELMKEVSYPEQVIYISRDREKREKYPILKNFDSYYEKKISVENRFYINVHLVSTIPCALQHIQENTAIGRENPTLRRAVREAIGLDTPKNVFVFGNTKRPRV